MKLKIINIKVSDMYKKNKERIWKIHAPSQHTFPLISW